MRNILVAYFSASGVTARVAKEIAAATGAELHEIRPAQPYTRADLDWTNKNSRSSVEMNDPACRPFLDGCDLTGKTLIPFATSGGSGVEGAVRNLEKAYPQARWKGGKLLNGGGAAAWAKAAVED